MKSQKLFPMAKMVEKDGGIPINFKPYDVFGGTLNTSSRTHSLQLGSCFEGSCCIGHLLPNALVCLVSRDIGGGGSIGDARAIDLQWLYNSIPTNQFLSSFATCI